MSSSRQFAIMSLRVGQKYYHKVCANYLSYSSISSIDSGKGSLSFFLIFFWVGPYICPISAIYVQCDNPILSPVFRHDLTNRPGIVDVLDQ